MLTSCVGRRPNSCLLSSVSALALGSVWLTTSAFGQEAQVSDTAGAAAAAAGAGEEVVVTGSRIGKSGFETPTPVTEISPAQLEVKQLVSVVDLFQDIPSLTPNQQQSDVVDVGVSNFQLRDLGATRTLVLINGLRTEFTSVNGGFDVNTLPTSLIQHVDIVTGGASAAYGSDAVAGVVNITLDTNFTGFKANVDGGISAYGDDGTKNASAAYGTEFANGRGHIVIGGEWFDQDGVRYQGSRPWANTNAGVIANPACKTIITTCTELFRTTDVVPSNMTDGGVIVGARTASGGSSNVLNNIQFGPGGVPEPFAVGGMAGSTYMIGGDGSLASRTMGLQAALQRDNALMHVKYDISNDVNAWAQFLFARSSGFYPIVPNFSAGNISVSDQNPFIPAPIKSIMSANNITSLVMGRSNVDLAPFDYGRDLASGINKDLDTSVGLKGKFGLFGKSWSWDVSGQYDHNLFTTIVGQNQITQNYANSIDSIANPAAGGVPGVAPGVPVCRSTLTNPNNGCVPIDLFGPNTVTPGVTNYIMGTSWVDAALDMYDASANIHGEPFSTWADPEEVAFGGEWRRQTTSSVSDPISAVGGFRNGNQEPYSGAYSVGEAYLELGTPLAKDLPLIKSLNLDTAIRATDYSTSGYVNTWKIGVNYAATDEVRFRATKSRDIRAPDLTDLYQSGALRNGGNVTNPSTGAQSIINTLTTGNPKLLPEIGDTITAGAVYTPHWLPGFNASLDYWHIKLNGAITIETPQQIINACFAGQQQYCSAIQYSPTTGLISQVASTGFNAGYLETDGFDFELGYRFSLADIFPTLGGEVQLHALGTYMMHYITSQLGVTVDEAGCVGNCSLPQLRYNLNAIYIKDPWEISLTGNWMGGGVFDQLYSSRYSAADGGKTINDNNVDGRFYVNLFVGYQISTAWQAYARVNNLFNVSPPQLPDTLAFQHVLSGGIYDRIGAEFLVGLKVILD